MSQSDALTEALYTLALREEEDPLVSLVYGHAHGAFAYYMESGNFRLIQGAGKLMERMFITAKEHSKTQSHADSTYADRTLHEILSWHAGEAVLLYAESDTFFVLAKPEIARSLAKDIEIAIHSAFLTLEATVVSLNTSVSTLRNPVSFVQWLRRLFGRSMERRYTKFPIPGQYDNDYWEGALSITKEQEQKTLFRHHIVAFSHSCKCCGFRKAYYEMKDLNGRQAFICPSCARKERMVRLTDSTQAKVPADGGEFVAMICARVNKWDALSWEERGSLPDYLEERKRIYEALQSAIAQVERLDGIAVVPLANRASDLCILVPGNRAMQAGICLMDTFEKQLKKHGKQTLCVGIAIAGSRFPITLLRRTADERLELAAQKSIQNANQSALDLQYAKDASVFEKAGGRREANAAGPEPVVFSLRPFLLPEAISFMKFVQAAKVLPPKVIRQISFAIKNMELTEAELWFLTLKMNPATMNALT
ncbi:MAG: hypothetical protein LBM60_05250, partial [Clostridium sp.]|nr:hypothetical protein [Clostridium sp.]